MGKQIAYRAVWIPSLIAIIVMMVSFARAPMAIPAPGEMVLFSTDDKMLEFKRPANWKTHSMSLHAMQTEAWMEPALNVKIHINSDETSSMIAGFQQSSNNMMSNLGSITGSSGSESAPEPKKKTPLESLHEVKGESMGKNFDDYQEGITTKLQISGLEAIETDFTYSRSTMFGKKQSMGARFTTLHADRGIGIVYYFPKDLETQVEPLMKQIVKSLKIGQGAQ